MNVRVSKYRDIIQVAMPASTANEMFSTEFAKFRSVERRDVSYSYRKLKYKTRNTSTFVANKLPLSKPDTRKYLEITNYGVYDMTEFYWFCI